MSQAVQDIYAQPTWTTPSVQRGTLDRVVAQISVIDRIEPPVHPYEAMDDIKDSIGELDDLLQADATASGEALRLQAEVSIMAMYRFIRSVGGDL